jgi:hypothetical protein
VGKNRHTTEENCLHYPEGHVRWVPEVEKFRAEALCRCGKVRVQGQHLWDDHRQAEADGRSLSEITRERHEQGRLEAAGPGRRDNL